MQTGESDPLRGAHRVTGMIDYQEGAVVSRTILKRPSGTITVFAFDGGQGLGEHSTPHEALVQVLEGEASVSIAGEAHRVRQGELILLPADTPHAVQAAGRFKMLLVMLRS